ncbi:DUF7130 family rubredoxin-like protein [Halosolutus gelatinilyticus]|uniref:DUF7130 family rubredoxin-like protein n=1 Tax=Halosolutus gelatinilyticus TaxID=2931975 RepID=UPI001FF2F386|nr:hypothetical protein [Halosolutus gelatinilyticus]
MSGHGEKPQADGEERADEEAPSIGLGEPVYNADGAVLGKIRGVEEGGFFVTTREGMEGYSIEHARSGHDFGEAHLMWRCMNCGEMGNLNDDLPETCPNCGAEKEELMWWTED